MDRSTIYRNHAYLSRLFWGSNHTFRAFGVMTPVTPQDPPLHHANLSEQYANIHTPKGFWKEGEDVISNYPEKIIDGDLQLVNLLD